MISLPSSTSIWIAAGITDMRRGFTGLCLFAKHLERGRFVWPQADQGEVSFSRAQPSMLLEGIDWRRPTRTAVPSLAV